MQYCVSCDNSHSVVNIVRGREALGLRKCWRIQFWSATRPIQKVLQASRPCGGTSLATKLTHTEVDGYAAVEEASMRHTSNQDRAQQLQHLEEAERHIAEGKRLIAEQERRLNELRRGGHDVAEAEKFLQRLRETQDQYTAHRELILSELRES